MSILEYIIDKIIEEVLSTVAYNAAGVAISAIDAIENVNKKAGRAVGKIISGIDAAKKKSVERYVEKLTEQHPDSSFLVVKKDGEISSSPRRRTSETLFYFYNLSGMIMCSAGFDSSKHIYLILRDTAGNTIGSVMEEKLLKNQYAFHILENGSRQGQFMFIDQTVDSFIYAAAGCLVIEKSDSSIEIYDEYEELAVEISKGKNGLLVRYDKQERITLILLIYLALQLYHSKYKTEAPKGW